MIMIMICKGAKALPACITKKVKIKQKYNLNEINDFLVCKDFKVLKD